MPQMTLDQLNSQLNEPVEEPEQMHGFRTETEANNIADQAAALGMDLPPDKRAMFVSDLRKGADVNIPGINTGRRHTLVKMSLDDLNASEPTGAGTDTTVAALKGTVFNTLMGMRDLQNMPADMAKRAWNTLTQKTEPGRAMTPDEATIAKNLGYGDKKWGSMSALSADQIKNAARANPELPGILNKWGKDIGGDIGEFLSNLNNVYRGVADNSIPSLVSKINPAAKERVRYAQVQAILASSQMLAHPEDHTKEQLDNALQVMDDYKKQAQQNKQSTVAALKEMGSAIKEHPGAATAGLVNALAQDPELIVAPIATAGRVGKALEGAGVAARTVAKAGAGAAEGGLINTGIYAAEQGANPEGVVRKSELGSNFAVGAGVGGILGGLARNRKAPAETPPARPSGEGSPVVETPDFIVDAEGKLVDKNIGSTKETPAKAAYEEALDKAVNEYSEAMARGDSEAMEVANEKINQLNDPDPKVQEAAAETIVSTPAEKPRIKVNTAGNATLPPNLAKANPSYFFGNKRFKPVFESDVDKAAYILAQKTPSKADAQYLKFVQDATGMSEAEARTFGRVVKQSIKDQAKGSEGGELIIGKHELPQRETTTPTADAGSSAAPKQEPTPGKPGKPQGGSVDPELLKSLGIRSGLIGAGATAGALAYPENKEGGAIAGALTGALLPLGRGGLGKSRGFGNSERGAIAGPLAEGADLGKLDVAKELSTAAHGPSPYTIWKDTGWYHDVDGRWKFEIPDTHAKLDTNAFWRTRRGMILNKNPTTLSDLLHHDTLWQSYPDIANTKVVAQKLPTNIGGYVDGSTGTIYINSDMRAYGKDTSRKSLKAVILHETQHKIQKTEDFATGGSPNDVQHLPAYKEELHKLIDALQQEGVDPFTIQNIDVDSILDTAGYKVYRRLKGETEARAVQTRSTFDPERLSKEPPYLTQHRDVPQNQQIVTRDSDTSVSVTEKPPLPEDLDLPNQDTIIEGIKNGDRRSTERFYRHFAPILKAYASRFARTIKENGSQMPVDPGELAHVALTKAIEHINSYKGDSSLSTWVHSILRNEGLMELRRGESRIKPTSIFTPGEGESLTSPISGEALGSGSIMEGGNRSGIKSSVEGRLTDLDTPEALLSGSQSAKIIQRTFNKMGSNQREAMMGVYFEGKSSREVAESLGVPETTVNVWLQRGRDAIKDALGKDNIPFEKAYQPKWSKQGGSIDPDLMKKMAAAGIAATAGAYLNKRDPVWGAILGAGAGILLGRSRGDLFKDIDHVAGVMSTRIKDKSEAVAFRLKEYYRVRNTVTHDLISAGSPFITGVHRMKGAASKNLQRAILNGDFTEAQRLIDATGNKDLVRGWQIIKGTIQGLGDTLYRLGMIKERQDNYFPRMIKDKEGLFKAIGKEKATSIQQILEQANRESIRKTGAPLSDIQQADIINKMVQQNPKPSLSKREGYSHERKFDTIPEHLQKYYANLAESYHSYVRSAVKNIELAKFFGRHLVNKEEGGVLFPDMDKSIGRYLEAELSSGKLNADDIVEVTGMIRSMFGNFERGGNRTIQAGKNITMAGFLGNPLSAVQQITTPVVTTYLQGVRPTLEAVARKLTGNQKVSVKDFGLADHMSEEFVGTTKSAKFLRGALKWGTFKFSDLFDKDIKLNAAVIKAQRLAQTEAGRKILMDKYGKMFGDRYDNLEQELKNKKIGEATKALAYNELSRSDPIDPMEFSQFYADNPNGRNLLALKSYMIKQVDLIRRDAYQEIKKGNRAKGIRNLAAIGLTMGLSGMSADAIKDYMLGRDVKFGLSDIPINMLKTFGWSEYSSKKAFGVQGSKAKQHLFTTVGETLAPPIPYQAMDDLWNRDPRAVSMIPVVGRFLAEYYKNKDKQNPHNGNDKERRSYK